MLSGCCSVTDSGDVDHHAYCSELMLRDLRRIKANVADPEMAPALLADIREYNELLARIQLELSAAVAPAGLRLVSKR